MYKIKDASANAICKSIGGLKKLTHLYLSFRGHEITDEAVKGFFGSIKELSLLEQIDIDVSNRCSDNTITDESMTAMLDFFKENNNNLFLHSFSINFYFNKLTDFAACVLQDLLPYFYNLSTILIDFSGNNLTEDGKTSIQTLRTTLDKGLVIFNT